MMMMKRWLLSFHVCGRLTFRIYRVDHGSKFGDECAADVCKTYTTPVAAAQIWNSTGTHHLSSHAAVLQASLEIVFTTTIFLFSGSCSDFGHLGPCVKTHGILSQKHIDEAVDQRRKQLSVYCSRRTKDTILNIC